MCNLYSLTSGQDAIREVARAMRDAAGNLPPMPGIFPDQSAPVVAMAAGERVLTRMRWGMPSPGFALKGRRTDPGVTNIRNTASGHWRRWLGTGHRCVVPFTSFCEYDARAAKEPVWFALGEDRPLAFFAGLWTRWASVRKVRDGETTDDLFGFLTTEPNAEVAPVHPKAMPVILTASEAIETWLTAPLAEALPLQRPLPDGSLQIVARGARRDPA
ncbi:MAG: SOS response-associated peptidase family protein [Rhodobacteraceae bacterium]|jgi:putative SOS response-associated peptidase YedK|nr:SOS response-associated peptidase family protein [Paracoccaceae bacterium]